MKDDFRIAGNYKVSYWEQLKDKLPIDSDSTNQSWDEAFRLFELRVNSRFLDPVDDILKMKKDSGEGFTAVAIQCILVEFFEAFY